MVWVLAFLWSYTIAVSYFWRVSPLLFMCYNAFSGPRLSGIVQNFYYSLLYTGGDAKSPPEDN
jgi:hypothetical protein